MKLRQTGIVIPAGLPSHLVGHGDVAAILDAVAEDVDWAAEAASSAAPWYGMRHGKGEVAKFARPPSPGGSSRGVPKTWHRAKEVRGGRRRDSKDPHGPVLIVSRDEWASFTTRVRVTT